METKDIRFKDIFSFPAMRLALVTALSFLILRLSRQFKLLSALICDYKETATLKVAVSLTIIDT